jgi:hypothetical protein
VEASGRFAARDSGHRDIVLLLIVLALIVLLGIALGFVIKWLFIIAVVAALLWLISFFAGRTRSHF